jgi:hypothetical protein
MKACKKAIKVKSANGMSGSTHGASIKITIKNMSSPFTFPNKRNDKEISLEK